MRTVLASTLLALAGAAAICGAPASAPPWVDDPAGLLSPAERQDLAAHAALACREVGVAQAIRLGAGDASAPVARPAPDGRAAVLGYDAASARLRLDVGYALEPILPDGLAGAWLEDHAGPLLERGESGAALLLTSRLVHDRVRSALLDGGLDPTSPPLAFDFGGAGAEMTLRAEEAAPRSPEAIRHGIVAAAADPLGAHAAYLAWLDGDDPPPPAVFPPDTLALLSAFPLTRGYREAVRAREAGHAFEAVVRGERALIVPLDDPLIAPHFARRDADGWRLDLAAEVRAVVNLVGGRYAWTFRSEAMPEVAPFADVLLEIEGFLRLAAGDNRPIPHAPHPGEAEARASACGGAGSS